MQMKLTPRDLHVLNVLNRQGFVAVGTEHCGTGTAAKLEHLGEADTYSFVDKKGAIRFCIVPHGSNPLRAAYVREHKMYQGAEVTVETATRVAQPLLPSPMYNAAPADVADMIISAMKIMQHALDKVRESEYV
jgi:hypothetical protein